jgi:integrase
MIRKALRFLKKEHIVEGINIKGINLTTVTQSDIISDEELTSLKQACKLPVELALIELLSTTGCRAGEIMSLKPSHISVDNDLVIIDITKSKTVTRTIFVRKSQVEELLAHLSTLIDEVPIFYSNYKKMRLAVIDIFKRANVRKRKRTLHIFRHTVATRLVESGMPEPLLRQFMGWSKTSPMPSVYVHLSSLSLKRFILRNPLTSNTYI